MAETVNIGKLLEHQEKIRDSLGMIVERAKNLAGELHEQDRKLEESAIRNVFEAARQARSAEVVKAFVLYQVGRGKLPERAAEGLNTFIDQLKQSAQSINPKNIPEVHIELVRHLLGFLFRRFVYLKYKDKENQEKGGATDEPGSRRV